MQRVKLDTAAPAVKDFIRSLPIETDDLELEMEGEVVCRVIRPNRLTESERETLVQKVLGQMSRSHERNKDLPVDVVEQQVRKAVDDVRGRRGS